MNDALKFLNSDNPFIVFNNWMKQAKADTRIREATAMTIATIDSKTQDLHTRVVLMKDWSEEGFTFFTNYHSRKGIELEANNKVALNLYWDPQFKQIKISGTTQKTSREISEKYWNSRPRDSQLSQWISLQSQPIHSREELEAKVAAAKQQFEGKDIPCPQHWGGYLVTPTLIEFWIGQASRLHDRFVFKKQGPTWTIERLYP